MKILIIGSGGREHAITWRLSQDSQPHLLYAAPGNPGIANHAMCLEIALDDHQGLLAFAQKEQMDLTIVGPEQPLADGLVDKFTKAGLAIFGPNQACAQLEASKTFAKQLMAKASVPTGSYTRYENPLDALPNLTAPPIVIKEDGLAAGKGVTVALTIDYAKAALQQAADKNVPVIIEDFLVGEELSVLAICDGQRAIPMVSAQDFKRSGEGNTGPNTGGMGSYAPVPFVDNALMRHVQADVLDPMMTTLQAEGLNYRGVLYAGLMIHPDGTPNVVEFNARFGDPETQAVLPLLDEDLAPILLAAANGDLSAWENDGFKFSTQSAVCVSLTSGGYPGDYAKGKQITLPNNQPDNSLLFHAGTKKLPSGDIVTNGGRVLSAVGLGNTLNEARDNAYQLACQIEFDDITYRRDIAEAAANKAPTLVS
jgi:phosphoribosylamine--glycine ligase